MFFFTKSMGQLFHQFWLKKYKTKKTNSPDKYFFVFFYMRGGGYKKGKNSSKIPNVPKLSNEKIINIYIFYSNLKKKN